jgi:O-antigen ligase
MAIAVPMTPATMFTRATTAHPHRRVIWAGMVLLAVVLGFVTALNPIAGAASFIGVLAVSRAARSGTFAVAAFLAASYFEVVTGAGGLGPIKLTGAALVVAAITALIQPAGMKLSYAPLRHPYVIGGLIICIGTGITSAAWATDLLQVRTLSIRLLTDAAVFVAATIFIRRPSQLRVLCWTALGAATGATLYGYVTGDRVAERFIGASLDPNEYAALVVPSLVLGYGAISLAASRAARVAGWGALVICSVGLAASQSRGGLVACAVLVGVLAVTAQGRERLRIGAGIGVMAIAAIVFVAVTPQGAVLAQRFADGDSSGRTDLWAAAFNMVAARPWTGVGLGNYPVVSVQYMDAATTQTELFIGAPRTVHNAFIEVYAELGVIGGTGFVVFVLGSVIVLARSLRTARHVGHRELAALARVILVAQLSALSSAMFLSGQYQELLWLLLAMGLACAGMIRTADYSRLASPSTGRSAAVAPPSIGSRESADVSAHGVG